MRLSARARPLLAVACLLAGALVVPARAGAVSYGIADAPSICGSWGTNACNSWSYGFANYYGGAKQTAFTRLKTGLPLRYVRLFAPYDAVSDATPSTGACRSSYDYTSHTSSQYPSGGGPGSAAYRLGQELRDARSAGLTALVAFTTATTGGQTHDGDPATPDVTAAGPGGPAATTTLAGEDYACGVSGLAYLTHVSGYQVGEWEAWNEPDGSPAYNGALPGACNALPDNCAGVYDQGTGLCGSTTYTQCGPLEAAGMFAELRSALLGLNARYGWPVAPIAAGTPSWPSTGYFNAYYKQLTSVLGQWPQYWSFHDYADVTSGQYAQSYAMTKLLHNDYASAGRPQPAVWITESGVVLTDTDRSYAGKAITCNNGESDDAGTLGACVDGNPAAQRAGATTFLNLATGGSYSPGQITELFWYQLQATNASTGWDSGLLAPPAGPPGGWSQLSPDGVYGSIGASAGLRAGFCVLARLPSTTCSSSPVAASDWSIQPRTVTGSLQAGQTAVTGLAGDQSSLSNGDFVTGTGIPPDTLIASGAGTSTWQLSQPASIGGSSALTASG